MKKPRQELEKELKDVIEELKVLNWNYPLWTVSKGRWIRHNLPPELEEKHKYLRARIRNLKTNINQAKMLEMNRR